MQLRVNGVKAAMVRRLLPVGLATIVFSALMVLAPALAADQPFANASNTGGTGLMETPNARVMPDGFLRFGYAQASPYRWYNVGMGVFPGLEVNGRVTELKGVAGEYFSNQKSRSVDLKYQVVPESKWFPALAVGLQDAFGDARLYPAEYVVLSRQYFPLDLSLGIGHHRLRGDLTLPGIKELGVFGAVELALNERIHLMAEYSPIEYEKDRSLARLAVPDGAAWPVNLGLRVKLFPGISLGLSFQRSDTLGIMLHLGAELGKPILPHRPDPPAWTPVDQRPFRDRQVQRMLQDIGLALEKEGFRDIRASIDGNEIIAEFTNDKYFSNEKAVGRVLRVLLFHSPSDCRTLTAVVRKLDMPMLRVSIGPEPMARYLDGKISRETFAKLIDVRMTASALQATGQGVDSTARTNPFRYNYGVKPELESYLLDRENYVQIRAAVKPWFVGHLWESAYAYARYDIPLYEDLNSSADIPPDAVRSDISEYLRSDPTFENLMVDQFLRISDQTFARIGVGYLEKMYAGVSGEVLTFLADGNWALGVEGDWAYKREPGTHFEVQDFDVYTVFGTIYRTFPRLNLTVDAKIGRFMYGDYGVRLQAVREYDTGAMIGASASFTDSHKFTGFNKNYNDVGAFFTLPIQMFLTHPSTTRYTYAMKPWTRDVGASLYHWNSLYWGAKNLVPAQFKDNLDKLGQ